MKVEFEVEEVWTMFNSIVDEILTIPTLKADKKGVAAIRRWRTDQMTQGSDAIKGLTAKVNREVQREHERQEVSPIKKPDWL